MIARSATALRRVHAVLVMGRKARVDCFQTVADLLDAGFELERALDVTAQALAGRGARAIPSAPGRTGARRWAACPSGCVSAPW